MLIRVGAASLLALSLYVGAAWAQQDGEAAPGENATVTDQGTDTGTDTGTPAADQVTGEESSGAVAEDTSAPVVIPPEVQALLDDSRPVSEMDVGELRNRARTARDFAKQQGLPDDVRARLQQIAGEARAELDARPGKAAGKKKSDQPAADDAAAQQDSGQDAAQQDLPADGQDAVQTDGQDSNQAVQSEDDGSKKKLKKGKRHKNQDQMQETDSQPADGSATGADTPPATGETADGNAPLLEPPVQDNSTAQVPQNGAGSTQPPVVDKKEVQELDANAGDPEAEKKARVYLDDPTPAEDLSDDDLKARLDGMRDLMADNELSQKSERALRKKLQNDRKILRERIDAKEAQAEQERLKKEAEKAAIEQKKADEQAAAQGTAPKGDMGGNKNRVIIVPQITFNTPVEDILRDRRRSEDLTDSELRRRVQVFRDAQGRDDWQDFDEEDRIYWQDSVRRDRELLRRRMEEERQTREDEMASNQYDDEELDIEDSYVPGKRTPRNVFEAEADDSELEDVLISSPKKKVQRRYSVEDIADNESLRDAMPRIEIDTIRFGFNEAFVREEEVGNLDRIASIIERVLRKRPREVFLIEGHTDAVGSDAYNLKLSRARAEAVKKALTTYYVIPPRNLQTVGLGERYLKIPTAEPEGENRRVSISRATPLVGELDE